jgi:hypothetical protein
VRRGGFIFQEVIEGPEIAAFCFVAKGGEVSISYQHLELASTPPDGGSAIAVRRAEIPRVDELARRIVRDFNYSGWGMIEFKYDRSRSDYVFMELNPKFWASIEFGLRTHTPFARFVIGHDLPAEDIAGLWWPGRVLRNGPLHWASGKRTGKGLARSWEAPDWRHGMVSLLPHPLRRLSRQIVRQRRGSSLQPQ